MKLRPCKGFVLVELEGHYEHVVTPERKYDSEVAGIVVEDGGPNHKEVKTANGQPIELFESGTRIFWEIYCEPIALEGKRYAFIKRDQVRGRLVSE